MVRSPGQIPNELDTGHTHLKSSIIDDETREPAEFSAALNITLVKGTVNFNDTPVQGSMGAGFLRFRPAAVTEGKVVIKAWAVVRTAFAGSGTTIVTCDIEANDPADDSWDRIIGYSDVMVPTTTTLIDYSVDEVYPVAGAEATNNTKVAVFRGDGFLAAELGFDGTLTAGVLDVYALIAEPIG